MVMMVQIDTSSAGIKSQSRTDFLTSSPVHHATLRCKQHPPHLAHPHLSDFHPRATRTTPPLFHLTVAKTTTMTLRSTLLSPQKPTLHILIKPTVPAPITEEDNLVVDVPTDGVDATTIEVPHQAEGEVITTTRNGPEMVNT